MQHHNTIHVSSEIGTLKRLLIHSPDSGIGKVVPSKAQDWLFEDILHLDTVRRKEYDYYIKLLLYFLDPEKIQGRLQQVDDPANQYNFYKPSHPGFYKSGNVIEIECLLADVMNIDKIKSKLVASVCALEGCTYATQQQLLQHSATDLAKIFISGSNTNDEMLFPPVPNFIFTRDIGIVINDHILLNKPAKKARTREALLMKYIFFNHPIFEAYKNNIIELQDSTLHFLLPKEMEEKKVTLEGGDVMVVSKDHVLIGISERTTFEAAHQAITILFDKKVVKKISLVKIPHKRDYMHIDTIFTQVKKNTWVMLGSFSKKRAKLEDADIFQKAYGKTEKDNAICVIQFNRKEPASPVYFDNLEDLLNDISQQDLQSSKRTKFIYSGNNEFPFDVREQWTDSCNVLALKEGVVLGYDRNNKTAQAFADAGYSIVEAKQLLHDFETGAKTPDTLKDTFISMPSAELSRARGGFHCMSMPLLREEI